MLADRYEGKRLNSPNDVVERSDGSIWFTDPSYGIDSDYEGHRRRQRDRRLPRLPHRPGHGEVRVVADDFDRPNGLAFSLDERQLYIADTRRQPHPRASTSPTTARCPAARSSPPATPAASTGSASTTPAGSGPRPHDGLHCFDPDGTLIGKLHVPEIVVQPHLRRRRNRNHLFITASTSVYAIRVNVNGAVYPR